MIGSDDGKRREREGGKEREREMESPLRDTVLTFTVQRIAGKEYLRYFVNDRAANLPKSNKLEDRGLSIHLFPVARITLRRY